MKVRIQGRQRRVKVVGKLGSYNAVDGRIHYIPPEKIPPIPSDLKPEDGRAEHIEYQQMGLNIIRKRIRLRKDKRVKRENRRIRQQYRADNRAASSGTIG